MTFTNTVDVVGDAALTRSIVDRSITELNDNISTSIRQQAFRACSALASVNFPSVTSVAQNAFYGCTALTKAEFASRVTFNDSVFFGCAALKTLILRSTEICKIKVIHPFAGSGIVGGGYIYVPAALVDQYKASWTAYAAQIRAIEDYPGIADPYSWAGVAENIADGSYKSVYKIGDTVPLDLGSEGLVDMQVAGIDADTLADGSGKAAISWVSKELLKTGHRMNPALVTNDDGTYQEGTGSIGGWEKSEMRAYLQETIYPLIPSDVQSMIKTVTKYSGIRNTSGAEVDNVATEDNIWIPSYREVGFGNTLESVGSVYSRLFADANSRKKSDYWWLRSQGGTGNFKDVYSNGLSYGSESTSLLKIALGFCT